MAKILIQRVVEQWKNSDERGQSPIVVSKCTRGGCNEKLCFPIPENITSAIQEYSLSPRYRVDIALMDKDVAVCAVEVWVTHKVEMEKKVYLGIPCIEVRGENILQDPAKWILQDDDKLKHGFRRDMCPSCQEEQDRLVAWQEEQDDLMVWQKEQSNLMAWAGSRAGSRQEAQAAFVARQEAQKRHNDYKLDIQSHREMQQQRKDQALSDILFALKRCDSSKYEAIRDGAVFFLRPGVKLVRSWNSEYVDKRKSVVIEILVGNTSSEYISQKTQEHIINGNFVLWTALYGYSQWDKYLYESYGEMYVYRGGAMVISTDGANLHLVNGFEGGKDKKHTGGLWIRRS